MVNKLFLNLGIPLSIVYHEQHKVQSALHSGLKSVHSIHSMQCTQYTVYTVCSIQCTLYTVYSIQCTLYTVYIIQCTLYTVYSVHSRVLSTKEPGQVLDLRLRDGVWWVGSWGTSQLLHYNSVLHLPAIALQ